MASNLANLFVSAVGAGAKPTLPVPAKSSAADDKFERHLDIQPSPQKDAPAAQAKSARGKDSDATASRPDASAPTAKAASVNESNDEENGTETGEASLADQLLSALSALGLNAEVVTAAGEGEIADPAALKDIDEALNELAQLLGMDVTTLMQQLAQLAKDASAEGGLGGDMDLAGKLNAWLGERLGAAGATLPDDAGASVAKLLAGLEQLAKPVPTQPNLGTAELKLPEPVVAPKAAMTETAEIKPPEPEVKVERDALQRTEPKKEADAPAEARKNDANAQPVRPAQEQAAPAATPVNQQTASAPNQVDAAAAPRVVQTGYQTSQQQLNLPQLAFEVSRQVQDGNTRFQIRLDPPELGRIDVKLDIDNRGQVHAKLTVEKAETLDLMQRDQRALEKALQQAGLDQAKTSLEFSLKQNPFAGDQNQRSDGERFGSANGQEDGEDAETPAPAITLYRGALQASGVNIIA